MEGKSGPVEEESMLFPYSGETLPDPLGPARGICSAIVVGSWIWGVLFVAAAWVSAALV